MTQPHPKAYPSEEPHLPHSDLPHSDLPDLDLPDSDVYILNWGTLDRYILRALWLPFWLSVSAFLSISLTLGTVFDLLRKVSDKGLPLKTALQIFGLQIPNFLVLALPMAMLLSCLMVYNRLARTSETIAFRSLGVSAVRLAVPGLLMGLWVTAATFMVSEFIVPSANWQASQLTDQALQQVKPAYRDKNIFYREFQDDRLSRVFYARRFNGEVMQDLTIMTFSQGLLAQILVTESGQWNPVSQMWDLLKGTTYSLGEDALTYQNINTFGKFSLDLSRAPLDLATEVRRADEMGILDTYQYWRLVKGTGDTRQTRQLDVRFQTKLAFPWVCLVFALVGAALGLQQQQRSSSKGFGLSVVIIFAYYTAAFITRSLGEAGIISSLIAAWIPVFVGFGVGGLLLRQANR
ncbi:MAG: LptF/LptG family permease [Thermosynechococcaceae cyanobacterium MS004]|nr:LptF/LptG family permease [Thermosynechococcaceae cyanobacterium MS004]